MKNMVKKILSVILTLSILCGFGTSVFAMDNNVIVLKDNNDVRVARAYIDGEEATVSFYKKTGMLEIKENGITKVVDTKVSNNLYSPFNTEKQYRSLGWGSKGKYQFGNSIFTMGYKVYYDSDSREYTWELDGDGFFNSKTVVEKHSNERILNDFKNSIDKAEEYWNITKGALIGAGAAGVVGAVLALVPEPFATKAAATAALVAAGASAGAALAAGGSYYTSRKYYNKAKDSYERI